MLILSHFFKSINKLREHKIKIKLRIISEFVLRECGTALPRCSEIPEGVSLLVRGVRNVGVDGATCYIIGAREYYAFAPDG
jgi:hypothetical protein